MRAGRETWERVLKKQRVKIIDVAHIIIANKVLETIMIVLQGELIKIY